MQIAGSSAGSAFYLVNQSLIFWEVTTVIVVVVLVALTALAFNHLIRKAASRPAQAILDERYARGEIGREEYERKRRDLRRR